MTNIIVCGGSGTRLWPISRTLFPKQFVKLFDATLGHNLLQSSSSRKSLFQLTVERNSKVCESQFIVSNAEQYFLALDKINKSYNIQYGTNFISVMPTNSYGPNDDFDLETSHVLPAFLRKMNSNITGYEPCVSGI